MIWKLLRQHLSVAQLAGFALANLCGMVIVLLGVQFYKDVLPVFTQGDSFMKEDYLIVSKRVSTLGSVVGRTGAFSPSEVSGIEEQPFTKSVGAFTPARFRVSAGMGWAEKGISRPFCPMLQTVQPVFSARMSTHRLSGL